MPLLTSLRTRTVPGSYNRVVSKASKSDAELGFRIQIIMKKQILKISLGVDDSIENLGWIQCVLS